jgi:hypothetical protein
MKTRKPSAPPEHTQTTALLALLKMGERERKRGLLRPLSEIVQRLRQNRAR